MTYRNGPTSGVAMGIAALAFVACSGGDDGGGGDSTGDDTGAAVGTGDGTAGTVPDVASTGTGQDTGVAAPAAPCTVRATGAMSTDAGFVTYQNRTVSVTAEHVQDQGCVNKLDLVYDQDGGCKLTLQFVTEGKYWSLAGGSFAVDEKCGFAFEAPVNFQLQADESLAAVVGLGDAQPTDEGTCARSDDARVIGRGSFVAKGAGEANSDLVLGATFNGLGFEGGILTQTGAGACPKEPPACAGLECGPDAYGVACGECPEEGTTCAGGVCVEGGCLPKGDGTTLGFHIADATWDKTRSGQPFRLHDHCEAPAVWMIRTATW